MTTNIRMEVMAAIKALEALRQPCKATLYSDLRYLVNGVNKGWARRWKKRNWMRTKTDRAANYDLWERLLSLLDIHEVEFVWVRGHSGVLENERCDSLAVAAARQGNLPNDDGYERRRK